MTKKVFLSYAHEDFAFVRAFTDKLPDILRTDSKALEVFDAQTDVNLGEDFRERIKTEMEAAGIVVIFSSPHSDKSQWVSYEAGMAEALGKQVVIVGQKGMGKSSLLRHLANSARIVEVDEGSQETPSK